MTQPTALIVDDDGALRQVLRLHLTSRGFACKVASDGAEALALLDQASYDLLVTDLDMPVMGGLDLLRRIRDRGLATRCIVITGYATIGNLTACLREGAVALIPKPLPFDDLDAAVALATDLARRWRVQMQKIVRMNPVVVQADRGPGPVAVSTSAPPSAAMVIIRLETVDGEEREERWPSVERFCAWAAAEGHHGRWTAYEDDPDGEGAVLAMGRC